MALGYLDDSKLYAIASAIRSKTSKSATMTVDEMPDEIGGISAGAQVEPLSVTENGTYTASSGYAYSPVTVNVSGGGGISYDDIAQNTVSGAAQGIASFIASSAFQYTAISGANFPNASIVYQSAFYSCKQLKECSFLSASTVATSAFRGCTALEAIDIPSATNISGNAFRDCYVLSEIYLPKIASIQNNAFQSCSMLSAVHMESVSAVPTLGGTSVFAGTPFVSFSKSASFYVPSSLYDAFKSAQYWSNFSASRFVSV